MSKQGKHEKTTTYLQCYGVADSFKPRSRLTEKAWGVTGNDKYVKLRGYWKDSGITAVTENYFVVESINKKPVNAEELHGALAEISRETIKKKYSGKYAKNVAYFASDSSLGYEYPPLSEKNVKAIREKGNPFSYKKLLRYAFAASHAYSIEKGAEPFSFRDNKNFKELMTPGGSGELAIIDTFKGRSGLYAAALDAPAVAGAGLDREIIIAYKGTSNIGDGIQDMKLMFTNFFESDTDWQRDAYDFCKRIIADYPPNERSLAGGYAKPRAAKTYNVVFTGHSLGGYTAIDAGVRTGVLTRVFSSPATRIIEKYVELFANKMRLNNVINFIRDGDPVATMSGRHDENMVYFPPGNFEMDPFRSHYLSPFITKVLEPLSQRPDDARSIPTHVYITPDTFVGAGLNSRINCWGRFKP